MTTAMVWAAAAAAWAQGPTMPERRLYWIVDQQPTEAQCAVLRDGTLVTLSAEWYDAAVARFFDPLGNPRLAPVTVVAGSVGSDARLTARGDGFVAVWWDLGVSNVFGQAFTADGTPVGGRFAVGSGDFSDLPPLTVKGTPDGGFIVTWTRGADVWARRYSAAGAAGAAFRANSVVAGTQFVGGLDVAADGSFTVTWPTVTQDNQGLGVFARRFDATDTALGPDIQVSAGADDRAPAVALSADGTSLVVWQRGLSGTADVYGRRYDAAGAPLGSEFKINAEDGLNVAPVAVAGAGSSFTVAWRRASSEGHRYALLTRTVATDGTLAGPSALAGTTPALSADLAPDAAGGFTLCWRGLEASLPIFNGMVARRYAALAPGPSTADAVAAPPRSDGNGILDPFERTAFRPMWRNHADTPVAAFTGRALSFEGPGGPIYTIYDDVASYGPAAAGGSTGCAASDDCYELAVDISWPRPVLHWDAALDERLSTGQLQRWRVHVGYSFWDMLPNSPYYRFVETLLHNGVTSGCEAPNELNMATFCPESAVTREQLAPFVLVAREGPGYKPDLTAPTQRFNDVPTSSPFYPFIEELARRGVVGGCAPDAFCPHQDVTRAEAAVIVLRTLDTTLLPPACGTPLFDDVPASSPFCRWVEELARRGVVNGCAQGLFCPDAPVTREQMAVVLTQAFGLSAYTF